MKQAAMIIFTLIFWMGILSFPVRAQQAPPPPSSNAPQLTHDEKMKLFDYEDQKQELGDKLQKEFNEQVKPIIERESAYMKLINEGHPGFHLVMNPGQPWHFEVDTPKRPEDKRPEPPKK